MYRIKLIVSLALILFAINIKAQEKSTAADPFFHSINTIGWLKNNTGHAAQLETINGMQFQSWFAGLGTGIDYQLYRSIPLFIDVRKELGKTANKLFVYADAGTNFYWQRNTDTKEFPANNKIKNGFYGAAGLGYTIRLKGNTSFLISAGYSYKQLTVNGNYYTIYPYLGPYVDYGPAMEPGVAGKQEHSLNRLVIKAGIAF